MTRLARACTLVGIAAGLACSPPPNILPTNDFNRPTDIAFMCMGELPTDPTAPVDGGGPHQLSGQPMRVCHPPPANGTAQLDPAPTANNRTFAFMTNSGSDDLSVVDADSWHIIDLDPETGLYGRLALGSLPEQLSATDDGCRLVVANRGSCDFSLVDPAVLLSPAFQGAYGGLPTPLPAPATARQQIAPLRADGSPLGAEPYEVVFLPEATDTSSPKLCPTAGVAPTTPWRALATFPACDLVALIDFPSGQIVDSRRVVNDKSSGIPTLVKDGDGRSPVCNQECGAGRADVPADAGASPDAAGDASRDPAGPPDSIAHAQYRPSGIAIVPGDVTLDRRAYVSLATSRYVMGFDLAPDGFGAAAPAAIELHETADSVGSTRIRLSVDPYKMETTTSTVQGGFVGDPDVKRYLYVLLGDGTVRIIDVRVPGIPKTKADLGERECETNVDPLNPNVPNSADVSAYCIPVDPSLRRPLLVGAGPGIRFPAIPVDVAAADIRPQVTGTGIDHSEATVGGAHAWVLTTSGNVYLVNIDPVRRTQTTVVQTDPVTTDPTDPAKVKPQNGPFVVQPGDPNNPTEPVPYPNSVRNRNVFTYSTSLDSSSGPPRVPVPPPTLVTGPYVETFWANGTRNNAFALSVAPPTGVSTQFVPTPVYFQDTSAVTPQTWNVTWEGALVPGRYSGQLTDRSTLKDPGANFCGSGVQPGDLLTFTGCTADNQCLPGFICHIDPTVDQAAGGLPITGLCVTPSDEASRFAACPEAFQTLRRYEITTAKPDTLDLAPHLDELVFSSLKSCEDLQAGAAAGGAGGAAGAAAGAGGAAGTTAGAGGAAGAAAGAGGAAGAAAGAGGAAGTTAGAGGAAGAAAGAAGTAGVQEVSCSDGNDPTTVHFTCRQHPDEPSGKTRCLQYCTTSSECRTGRICLSGGTRHNFCADAPYLAVPADSRTTCTSPSSILDQLVTYKVNAGGSFVVSGTATGVLASNTVNSSGTCAAFTTSFTATPPDQPQRDWRLVGRIPMSKMLDTDGNLADVTTCPVLDNGDDNSVAPTSASTTPNQDSEARLKPLRALATKLPGSPCVFMGGPAPSDTTMGLRHARAFFENTDISFVLANIDRAPVAELTIPFDVNGGSGPQFVLYPSTVEVSEAARIVLGPIDSLSQTPTSPPLFEAPYLFVVDQRRLGRGQGGGATRGQLVRINPVGYAATIGSATGVQPTYEDYTRSGNLFPIQ